MTQVPTIDSEPIIHLSFPYVPHGQAQAALSLWARGKEGRHLGSKIRDVGWKGIAPESYTPFMLGSSVKYVSSLPKNLCERLIPPRTWRPGGAGSTPRTAFLANWVGRVCLFFCFQGKWVSQKYRYARPSSVFPLVPCHVGIVSLKVIQCGYFEEIFLQ